MKRIFLLLVSICNVLTASAQDDDVKGFDRSKLFVGGNFGAGFGNVMTSVNVSPQIGYRFSRHFAAGAGVNFQYNSYKYAGYKEVYGFSGLNVFGRVYPIDYILLQAQPELNYSWGKFKPNDGSPSYKFPGKFVPSLLLGGGAAIPTGGNGAFLITIMYDVIQDARSPYSNKAFYNFGYNIGL